MDSDRQVFNLQPTLKSGQACLEACDCNERNIQRWMLRWLQTRSPSPLDAICDGRPALVFAEHLPRSTQRAAPAHGAPAACDPSLAHAVQRTSAARSTPHAVAFPSCASVGTISAPVPV